MSILKPLAFILFVLSSLVLAITGQDLEQMRSELDNPITLENVEMILLESGIPFIKTKSENRYFYDYESNGKKIFSIRVDFHSYAETKIIYHVGWYSDNAGNYSYYKIVDGRLQTNEFYYSERSAYRNEDSLLEFRTQLMRSFNSILDKIGNWSSAIQMNSSGSLSERLETQGVCTDGYGYKGPEKQTCNYRVDLDDGSVADLTIEYMHTGVYGGKQFTPVSFRFNDNQMTENDINKEPIKTVKIGKQEWMDHNLLYGEGLTEKYGVNIIANEDLSNITDSDNNSKSIALPSGEQNSWLVFMDLNLRHSYGDYTEKPNIKENHQGVCPSGFHVPTIAEWKELFSFVARDKVKFPKYDLLDEYNNGRYESEKSRRIADELDKAYRKWRKGKKDRFWCMDDKECRFNKIDMQESIQEEIIKHLCAKGMWPLDENGDDICLDSYGFSMPSNSLTGNDMSYWTADAKVSECHDYYEKGHHHCFYTIEGYSFSVIVNGNRKLKFVYGPNNKIFKKEFEKNVNLRCLKNRSKK